MNAEIERLSAATYVALTTFRKDGTSVATPVWVSSDGDHLYVWTEAASGKAKRLRNDPRVLIAPSDGRGTPQGAEVGGTAALSEAPADLDRVRRLHQRKYSWQFWAFDTFARLFRRRSGGHVVLEISLSEPTP